MSRPKTPEFEAFRGNGRIAEVGFNSFSFRHNLAEQTSVVQFFLKVEESNCLKLAPVDLYEIDV